MSILFPILSSFYFLMFFFWIFLFAYLLFKVLKTKLLFNYKLADIQRQPVFGNISYQKAFYLLLLMFVLTQILPYHNCFTNSLIVNEDPSTIINYFISIFTLLTFYFFVFAFFTKDTSNNSRRKYCLQFISFVILFCNLFFNLIAIPNQTLGLLETINTVAFISFIFIYILVFHLFLNIFKYFFSNNIMQLVKLTFLVFKHQGLKFTFINSENKNNMCLFFKQWWSLFLLVSENKENYILLLTITIDSNLQILTSDFSINNNKIVRKNMKFINKYKTVFLKKKILKDYIVVNGWKMSLIQ